MSWSLTFIGKPENIVKALEEQSIKLSGQSKDEFDAALPHLVALVKQNSNSAGEPVLKIVAHGHGYVSEANSYRNCGVQIENIGGTMV